MFVYLLCGCACVGEILNYITTNVAGSDILAQELEGNMLVVRDARSSFEKWSVGGDGVSA